jgi:hypothetical protein
MSARQIREEAQKRTLARLIVPAGRRLEKGKLYLHLYHGRNTPDENLEDWGFRGPTFGPLDYFHITYLTTFRFAREDLDCDLATAQDLFVFDGAYYGDLVVFVAEGTEHG